MQARAVFPHVKGFIAKATQLGKKIGNPFRVVRFHAYHTEIGIEHLVKLVEIIHGATLLTIVLRCIRDILTEKLGLAM